MTRWEGVVTANTSISHGGESLGTVRYLRRERMVTAAGIVELPVVSGNAVRGRLRDVAGTLWWEDAARPALTLPVAHAIFSGGALTKAVGEPLSGGRLQQVKFVCPPIAVFGAAGGGRIIDGALQVGKMIPVCAETAHLLPDELGGAALPDLWDLTQIEWYSHHPDATLPDGTVLDDTSPARYGVETFLPGCQFFWWVSLDRADDRTTAFFADVMDVFRADAVVGGNTRIGLGRLNVDVVRTPAGQLPGVWRRHGNPLTVEERETLEWLG